MKGGIWVWPTNPKMQRRTLRKVSRSPQLSTLLKAIAESSEGLSNPEVGEVLGNDSGWLAIWAVRQLLSLGFVTYKTDLFGEPSRYVITAWASGPRLSSLDSRRRSLNSLKRPFPNKARLEWIFSPAKILCPQRQNVFSPGEKERGLELLDLVSLGDLHDEENYEGDD